MSYADTLLSTGERIVHREQPALVRHASGTPAAAILGLILAIVLFVAGGGLPADGGGGTLRLFLGWLTLVLLVGGLVWRDLVRTCAGRARST